VGRAEALEMLYVVLAEDPGIALLYGETTSKHISDAEVSTFRAMLVKRLLHFGF
jgi:hypothetical protein